MNAWLVRKEGAHAAVQLPTVEAVIAALRDGLYDPTDEVKGPTDAAFTRIEAHPALEEAASEVEFYRGDENDETHLDMNPLIDVCLVLLIFFILTITYESLRRSIQIPQSVEEEKGAPTKVDYADVKDRVFRVTARGPEAQAAYQKALSMMQQEPERRFLEKRLEKLQKNKSSDAVELGASQTTKGAGQNKTQGEQL